MSVIKANGIVGIGPQVSENVGVVPSAWFRVLSGNLNRDPNILTVERTGGRDQTDHEQIGYDAEFTLELNAGANAHVHKLIWYALGSIATTGSGPYTHTVTPAGVWLPSNYLSLSFDRGVVLDTDETLRGVDTIINELVVSIEDRGIAKITASGMCRTVEEVAPLTPAYLTEERYTWEDYGIQIADYPTLPVSALSKAGQATLTIRNNFDMSTYVAGDAQPDVGTPGRIESMLQIEKQLVASDPLWAATLNETRKNVAIQFSKSVGGNTWLLRFDLNECLQTTFELPEISGEQTRGMLSTEFKGTNDGSNPSVRATLIDTVADHAA